MTSSRAIVHTTRGRVHGPITRLMSPGDLGHQLKPFVFLDYIDAPVGAGPGFGFHPHSGIATLTFPLTFGIRHEVSTGQVDDVSPKGIEWLIAGGGIWHKASPLPGTGDTMQGFQIWFALPASHENTASSTMFIEPKDVPQKGPVTLILGRYEDLRSPVPAPFDASYLWVELKDGESFNYEPPAQHNIAWAFAQSGELLVSGHLLQRDMAVFEEGHAPIHFTAQGDCGFLLGSAAKHPHDLVLGYYSVHTSEEALAVGESNITKLGDGLRARGLIR
jgi:redox-sensitive bicupin YhaK (pirin superfamily)